MASQQGDTFKGDVKTPPAADEAQAHPTLPEYTRLPASPPGSSPAASVLTYADHGEDAREEGPTCAEGRTIVKLLWTGFLALAIPPAIAALAALASAGAMLYGAGKVLEGVGRGLAAGPELLYRTAVAGRVKKFLTAARARTGAGAGDLEGGRIAI